MASYLQNPFVLLGIANVIVFGILLAQWSFRNPCHFLLYAFSVSFFLSTLWASLIPRSQIGDEPELASTGKETWQWVMNFQEILAASVILFIVLLFISRRIHPAKQVKVASSIFVLFAATAVIGTIFTQEAGISRGLIIPTAFLVAVLLFSGLSIQEWFRHIIFGLGVIVVGSLISLIVAPEWALSGRGDGLFGLDGRLLGLTRHPNSLGYLSVLLIVVIWWAGLLTRLSFFLIASSVLVLVLTVSRTAWIAAIVVASIWVVFRFLPKMSTASRIQTSFGILGFGATLVISGVWLGFISLEDRIFSGATTLTGRTYVWHLSWELWKGSPFFGYGTDAWSIEWRDHFGLPWAGQAHNQFFDTLVTSGALGVIALLVLVGFLIKLAIEKAEESGGASIALVGVLIIRGITESPLGSASLDQMFFATVILFLLLLLPKRSETKAGKQSRLIKFRNESLSYR